MPDKNINILFITFYGLIEYVGDIINAVDEYADNMIDMGAYGIRIKTYDFPYLHHHITEKQGSAQITDMINRQIMSKKITHVFWFFFPDDVVMKSIKTLNPTIKTVFYNFDDPKSFNIELVRKAKYIDYFINPSIITMRKYMYILDRDIHYLPLYIHKELLMNFVGTDADDGNNTMPSAIAGLDTLSDDSDERSAVLIDESQSVTILVDDDYVSYDWDEKQMLRKYVAEIKDFCHANEVPIRMYGHLSLEDDYQDVYEDTIDILVEGRIIAESKIVIVLDLKAGLDKRMNALMTHCAVHDKVVLTNSNLINRISTNLMNRSRIKVIDVDISSINSMLRAVCFPTDSSWSSMSALMGSTIGSTSDGTGSADTKTGLRTESISDTLSSSNASEGPINTKRLNTNGRAAKHKVRIRETTLSLAEWVGYLVEIIQL